MFNVKDWLQGKQPTPTSPTSPTPPAQAPSDFRAPTPKSAPAGPGPEISKPPEKPFMAEAVDVYGQPYYGTGFQGWAKGTFARIFDPKNFISNIRDGEFQNQAVEQADDYAEGIQRLTRWDDWGEQVFGISSRDLGASLSAMQAEKHEAQARGDAAGVGVSLVSGTFARATKEMGMTTLGAFGIVDYFKRKDVMARQAQYELAQESDLYRQAKEAGAPEWLLGRGAKWESDWAPNGGFMAENPIVGKLFDPMKMVRSVFQGTSILLDRDTRGKYLPTLKKYWQGSGMAYTMVSDSLKRQEFIDRVNAGDDPGLVAAETGNVWTEVGGSLFNDPTTYLGMSIYGKGATILRVPFTGKPLTIAGKALKVPWQKIGQIPTFGEFLGVGLKATRTKKALEVASAIPAAADEVARMESVADAVGGWEKLGDEAQAFDKVRQMGVNLLETIRQWDAGLQAGKLPNARTMTTASVKASQFYRNAHDALGIVVSGGGTADDRLESLNILRRMHAGSDVERAEAVALAVKEHGQLAMSDSFLQLGKFLASFGDDADIVRLVSKTGENPAEVFGKLAPKLDQFAKQFYPSMDEMAEAAGRLTEKADDVSKARAVVDDLQRQVDSFAYSGKKPRDLVDLEKQLDKARKGFDAAFGRDQELAQAYEQIHPLARKGREMLRVYEKAFFRPAKRYMDTIFLAIRPAQYAKQLQSQTALIAMDLGFLDAVEIAVRTVATSFSDNWTAKMIKSNSDEITKILGFAPEAMSRGVTAAGEAKGKGFLRVSGNLDSLMSSEIVLRTARREMDRILKNSRGLLDLKRLEGVFTKDELGVLNRMLLETGSEVQAVQEFAKTARKGVYETWRSLPMPDKLKDFTQQTKVYEQFVELQKTARTRQEFLTGVEDLVVRMQQQARRVAAADPAVVDEATHEVMRQSFLEAQDLASRGLVNEAETKIFNNTVNAYEYMRRNLEAGAKEFRNAVDVMAAQAGVIADPGYRSAVQTLDEATGLIHDMYPKYDETARLVREVLNENKSLPSLERAQLLDNARFDVPTYTGMSLDELGALEPREFERRAWSAYFSWGREYWKQVNTEALARTVESLDAIAETAGTSVEDVLARSSTVRDYLFEARRYQQQAAVWENNTRYVSDNLAQIAQSYSIPTASEKGVPLSKGLLKTLNENLPEGIQPFTDYRDAQSRIDDARIALSRWEGKTHPDPAAAKVDEFLGKAPPPSIDEIPPVVHPGTATGAQAMHANLIDPKFLSEVQAWTDSVTEKWGSLQELPQLDGPKRAALADWQREAGKRMKYIRAKIAKVSTMQRDDLLLSYDKSYGDLALAYLGKPYHYYQTHQYAKTFGRFLDHPSWANTYLKYKEAMAKENADLPEWYRYNIQINKLFGVQTEHPIFVNLESAINPIYDLTGTDFNDPYRRVDWLSRTVDDLGKTGGTFMPPIQWAVGLHLYRKGEADAAQRWMGRVLGQTGQAIKAGLTAAGADINIGNFVQHNEVDPFVNFLSGGMDANERKRIGRQMAGMIEDGLDPEAALDAMLSQSGELYDEAVRQSVIARSPAELKSFFLGVNWKPRTEQDAQIDTFYQEYYQLRAQADFMPPEDYRRAWDLLRDKYEFMDTVLLSGKNTSDRQAAYTYNVLGRVPPGQSREIYEAVGLDPRLVQTFFDTKGEMTGVPATDQQVFLARVADIGAMLAIPDYTTKQDWNTARDNYRRIQDEMKNWFGDDIGEQIDHFYTLDDKQRQAFAQINPRVQAAIDWQTQQVVANPQVYRFYGGLGSLERFHKGRVYAQLDQEFGEGIQATWDQYYDMQMRDPKGASKFKRAHPELNAYTQRKKVLMDVAIRNIVNFASVLPEADEPPTLRTDLPTSLSGGQQGVLDYAAQPPAPTFEQWAQQMPTETQLIAAYWSGEIQLPSAVVNSLEYKARDYGYASGDDLLQAILISMQR